MSTRRQLLKLSAGVFGASTLGSFTNLLMARELPLIQRAIPSSGEMLPVIGMGTSRTFDKKKTPINLLKLSTLVRTLVAEQGKVIDSSPMYGEAEARVGDVLRSLASKPDLFTATKVWIEGEEQGIAQMEESARRMNVERFDLIAVHNLKDWKTHLGTLKRWKAEGKVRYIGITTSHGRDHEEFANVMRNEPLDFAQFSYNLENREAEKVLLPLAADRGIATMINRPFQQGSLFARARGHALPDVAKDIDCTSWAQLFLKFIVGHEAVTCVIPATTKAHHMSDNMAANYGRLPDAVQRRELVSIFESL
jgi:diketogulonate reductase-like aldo/keto reductase